MTASLVQEFEALADTATVDGPEWLEPIRRAAMERFSRTGFPTARDEEWRFTPLGAIAQGRWRLPHGLPATVARERIAPFTFGHADWITLVFVNGALSESLSEVEQLPRGVRIGSLGQALRGDGVPLETHLTRHAPVDGSPFTALNTTFFREGGLIHVPAGVDLGRPVHLVFVTTPDAAGSVIHPRSLIVVERGARASVIESYVTLAEGQELNLSGEAA